MLKAETALKMAVKQQREEQYSELIITWEDEVT